MTVKKKKNKDPQIKKSRINLKEENRLLRLLVDTLPEANLFIKDANLKYLFNNTSHLELLGARKQEDALGKTDLDFFPKDIARHFYNDEQYILQTGRPLMNIEETVVDQTTTKLKWLLTTKVPFFGMDDKIAGIVGLSRNITRIKSLEEALMRKNALLHKLSLRDGLTRVYNRLYLERDFPSLLSAFSRTSQPLSALLLDIDDFKEINDTLGHHSGDIVLKQTVSILRSVFNRKSDIIVRFGGDEFLVLLFNNPALTKDAIEPLRSAEQLAHDILVKMSQAEIRSNHKTQKKRTLHVSIGITQWKNREQFSDLLIRVDKALYKAKRAGKNQYATL